MSTIQVLNNLTSLYEAMKAKPDKVFIRKDFYLHSNNIKQYMHTLHHLGFIDVVSCYVITGKKLTARKLVKGYRIKRVYNETKL